MSIKLRLNTATVTKAVLAKIGNPQRETDAAGAEASYREAITGAEGRELPVGLLSNVRMNLATLLDFSDRESDAAPFYEEAITDFEALAAPENLEVAAQLRNNLAMSYKGMGKFALAEQHYLRALETLEAKHGRDSEAVATVFNNLGGLYYVAGFPDQAKEMFADALAVRVKILGESHRDTAQSYSNLATACHELGENDEAKKHFETALQILQSNIQQEARSFEATSLDYIAMLEAIQEEDLAADVKNRMDAALANV